MAKITTDKRTTVLGSETYFNGKMKFTDELLITGKFEGEIDSSGNIEIEKDATCEVTSITASSIVVKGSVKGDLFASDTIEMNSGSSVYGDISTSRLRIEDNVDFQGQVTMLEDQSYNDIFSYSSNELREQLFNKNDSVSNSEEIAE